MSESDIVAFLSSVKGDKKAFEAIKGYISDFNPRNTKTEHDFATLIISLIERYQSFEKVFTHLCIDYHKNIKAITLILNNYAISRYIESQRDAIQKNINLLGDLITPPEAYQTLVHNFNNLSEDPLKFSKENIEILKKTSIGNPKNDFLGNVLKYFESLNKYLEDDEKESVDITLVNKETNSKAVLGSKNSANNKNEKIRNPTVKSFLPKLLLSDSLLKTSEDTCLFWSNLGSQKIKKWAFMTGIYPQDRGVRFCDVFIAGVYATNAGRVTIKDLLKRDGFNTNVKPQIYLFLWDEMSRGMASRASGIVFVLSPKKMGRILSDVEIPALKANENVTSIVHINAKVPQRLISLYSRQNGEILECNLEEIDYGTSFYDPGERFAPANKQWLQQDSKFLAVAILPENGAIFICMDFQVPYIKSHRFFPSSAAIPNIDPESLPSSFVIENMNYQSGMLILSQDEQKFKLEQKWFKFFNEIDAKAIFIDILYGRNFTLEKAKHDSTEIDSSSVFFKIAKAQYDYITHLIEFKNNDELSLVRNVVYAQCEFIAFNHEKKFGLSNELLLFQISTYSLLIQSMSLTKMDSVLEINQKLLTDQRNYLKAIQFDDSLSFQDSPININFSSSDSNDDLLTKFKSIMKAQNAIIFDKYLDSIDENVRKILENARECISLLSENTLNVSPKQTDTYLLVTQEYLLQPPPQREPLLHELIRAQSDYIFHAGIKVILHSRLRRDDKEDERMSSAICK